MESLQEQLLKSVLWLERLNPQALAEIETKLAIAQKEILSLMAETKNKAVITREVNRIFNESFSTFETVLNNDVENITELSYNATGVIMTGWVATEAKSIITKWVDVRQKTKAKLLNPKTLIQGHTLAEHTKHLTTTNAMKVRGLIFNGFDNGLGIDEISRNIKNAIGHISRNQVKTLAKTSMFQAIQESQNELFDNLDEFILYYEYLAVLDNRVSIYCFNAHGYKTKDKKTAKFKPKSHWNCRSLWNPVTEMSKEFEDEQQRLVMFDGKKVNHRDGTKSTKFKVAKVKQVPTNASKETIFNAFGKEYQIGYLGKARYNMWKSGKASLKEMMDISKNRLVPIDMLTKKLNL